MTSRSRQSRRTPQSSSGTIPLSLASQELTSRGHEYASPRITNAHHSNPSLPTLAFGQTNSVQDRIVRNLVDKLNAKLPCYSGHRLSDIEENESVLQLVEGLVELSRRNINVILFFLFEVLTKLNTRYTTSKTAVDVLESELFVLRLLIRLLTFHWNTHAEESGPTPPLKLNAEGFFKVSDDSAVSRASTPLINPPSLDEMTATYALVCMLTYVRRAGPSKIENLIASEGTEELNRLKDLLIFEQDSAVLHTKHYIHTDDSLILDPLHSNPTTNGNPPPPAKHPFTASQASLNGRTRVAPFIPSALTARLSTGSECADIPLIHVSIKSRAHKIRYLAGNPGDESDIAELLFVTYSLINRNHLIEFLQILPSLLINMKPDSQCAIAVVLRLVVWKWINDFGEEYEDVIQSPRRRLDGLPERVYDILSQLTTNANKHIFWPTLSLLLAISPERLQAAEAALTGILVYGKKHNNLLELLHVAITTQSKLGETAMRCYNDICQAAFHLPPNIKDCALHSLTSDLADELKSRLVNPPEPSRPFYESFEPIDVNLYADSILTVLRYNPTLVTKNIFPVCLEPHRSAAVKLCVVRALTLYVAEARKFPWQRPLDNSVYQFIAPRLRSTMTDLFGMPPHPMSLREKNKDGDSPQAHNDRKELLLAIQTLWRLDSGFVFSGMDESSAVALTSALTNIVHKQQDEVVHASIFRTFGTALSRINDPSAQYTTEMNDLMMHSAFVVLKCAAAKILEHPDDLELSKMNVGTSLAVLLQLLDDVASENHVKWKYNDKRSTCLAVSDIALLTLLTSARIDICSLAARGLRLMAQLGQDPIIPGPMYYTEDKPAHFMALIESVGDPKSLVLGRVEFQKRARQIAGPLACPCISQLAAWRENYFRWTSLQPIIYSSESRSSSEISSTSDATLFGRLTLEERQWTWENLTLMLAVSSGSCLSDDPSLNPPPDYRLPFRQGFSDERPSRLMERFIYELLDILTCRWIPAQLAARDALGSELNPKWFPLLLETMDNKLKHLVPSSHVETPHYGLMDQLISILKLVLERITVAESSEIMVDLGDMLVILSRFINQPYERNFDVRIKTKFCAMLDIALEKLVFLPVKNEDVVRNNLLEIVIGWIWETDLDIIDDGNNPLELMPNRMDFKISALKTVVNLSDKLQLLGSSGKTTDDMDLNVPSRLFRRYFGVLIGSLESKRKEVFTIDSATSISSEASLSDRNNSQIQQLVITAISNLLCANPTAGAKHLVKENNTEYRSSYFMRSLTFARVEKPRLLDSLSSKDRLGLAYEFSTDIFRANDLCGRIFSGFAKSHGYAYLRSIVSPLIVAMQSSPEGTSYEVDPSKIKPGDSQDQNASNLERVAGVFLAIVTESWNMVPDLVRESCRIISDAVQATWNEPGYHAIGAFFFLRFVVPAITSPETIDLELPRDEARSQSIRRGLILVAKVVQNAVNNIIFAKEAYMKMLNGLLAENRPKILEFYQGLLTSSPAERNRIKSDELLGSSYDEADTIILHRFFQNYREKIGSLLLGPEVEPVAKRTKPANSKTIWNDVCNLLVDATSIMSSPTFSEKSSAQHSNFRTLYGRYAQASLEPVRGIFQSLRTWRDPQIAFLLNITKIHVETIDFELLMFYVLTTIRERIIVERNLFDVIVDFTSFSPSSEVPLSWVRTLIENTPSDLSDSLGAVYLVNINTAAQSFLRKIYHLSPGLRFCQKLIAVSSVSELIPPFHPSTVASLEYANQLEEESKTTCFTCQQHLHDKVMTPTTIYVGTSHLRIVSVKPQQIYPNLSCKTVEVVPYTDIRDIALSTTRNDHHEFVIRRFADGSTLTFWSIEREREKFIEMVRIAKARIKPNESVSLNERARHSMISTSLLATALFGVCDESEPLRESAFSLLSAVCESFKFRTTSAVSLKDAGLYVPTNTAAYICSFSETLSAFIPHLTLDFMAEFCLSFEMATSAQRITALQYLHPWIKNLKHFGDPAHDLYEAHQRQLKDVIGSLIDITARFADVFPCALRWVWADFAKFESQLLNVILDALIQTAVDGGIGSQRCEQVGDILISIATIDVRARVLKKIKAILSKPGRNTRSLTKSLFWPEITTLSRLVLKAGYVPRLSLHTQLYMSEAIHLVTMVCSTGSLYMRSTVYGIAMNLIQNLRLGKADNQGCVAKLDELMKEMGTNEVLNKFGLMKVHPESDIISVENCPDQIPMSSLEGIAELFIRALTYGAGETGSEQESGNGLLNVWRARWMSLVSSTAFQPSPYVQYRSFIVMGVLASSGVLSIDENLLYQTLSAFKKASQEDDASLVRSMLHFMTRVLPGFESNSPYLPRLFWLTVGLLQSTYSSLYEESAMLLEVVVETLSKQGYFKEKRMSLVLLDARDDISVISTQLDTVMGVSFDAAFSVSLASIVFRGMRSPALQPSAKRLLRTMLRIAAESLRLEATRGNDGPMSSEFETTSDGNMLYLDYEVMGYFLTLLPFAWTSSSYRELLRDAGITEIWWPALTPISENENDEEDDSTPLVDPSIFHLEPSDNHTPLLIISLLFAMLDCYQGSEPEKAFIFLLLARMGDIYPDITATAVVHFLSTQRADWLINSLTETTPTRSDAAAAISSSVQTLFRIAMANPVWGPTMTAAVQTGNALDEHQTNHWRALEELDMHSLAMPWKVISRSEARKILQWIPALLVGVTTV
ncbi:hypothetical protein Clacol_001251 [Clathrus columnatus]|uniref:Ras-GAP domain-containing protein n=1 Tax=Clathrus columnatus TaxID=1419009 RepID=A0AAV4ZXY3_9AGAM|nr:hypothetical protein Clacol_001251 [Clathrus columnatus]